MKYEVTLACKTYASIMVEADSASEAEGKVSEMLRDDPWPPEMDTSYEPDDWEVIHACKEEEVGS